MACLSGPTSRTRGRRREGLPCPISRARSPAGRICASSSSRPNAGWRPASSARCTTRSWPSPASTTCRAGPRSRNSSARRPAGRAPRSARCAGCCPGSPGPVTRAGPPPARTSCAPTSPAFLTLVPPAALTSTLGRVAGQLGAPLAISRETPLSVRAQLDGLGVQAAAEAAPPHRLSGCGCTRWGPGSATRGPPRRPATRPATSRPRPSRWPRNQWPSSACPAWCWPAPGPPAQHRGRSPAAGPTWTAARRCTAATASRPTR